VEERPMSRNRSSKDEGREDGQDRSPEGEEESRWLDGQMEWNRALALGLSLGVAKKLRSSRPGLFRWIGWSEWNNQKRGRDGRNGRGHGHGQG
jgi:hypothetical protein